MFLYYLFMHSMHAYYVNIWYLSSLALFFFMMNIFLCTFWDVFLHQSFLPRRSLEEFHIHRTRRNFSFYKENIRTFQCATFRCVYIMANFSYWSWIITGYQSKLLKVFIWIQQSDVLFDEQMSRGRRIPFVTWVCP